MQHETWLYSKMESPLGRVILAGSEEGLAEMSFEREGGNPIPNHWREEPAFWSEAQRQLEAYFAAELKCFELKLDLRGTEFQLDVWKLLLEIPFGLTTSYGELARQVGRPNGARAVGAAVGSNPVGVIVPCHRVIGAKGAITGYAGGLHRKSWLLHHEGVTLFS